MRYRAEIDGLRAVAVLSVIFYHARLALPGGDWFSGGYIGVDIFFVISGYLITRIILAELQQSGSFSYKNFYKRRARRIFPLLVLVMACSFPFAWVSLLPSDFVAYSKSLLASLFFVSNFFFYFSTTEYGANSALLLPFLHTWSLGIEEQFYIFFPLVFILSYKIFNRKTFLLIGMGILFGVIFAEFMSGKNQDMNFYLPFSRMWELLAGSLLVFLDNRSDQERSKLAQNAWPILGLGMICCAIILFDHNTSHPGVLTLVPVLGAMLIIGFSGSNDPVGKLLSSAPFVSLGLISYSVYLWHYPVFAFFRMWSPSPQVHDKILWIGLTVLLSIISYKFIEQPMRKDRNPALKKKLAMVYALAAFCLVLSCIFVIKKDGLSDRLPAIYAEDFEQKPWLDASLDGAACFKRKDDFCKFPARNSQQESSNIILFGASHLATLQMAVIRQLGDNNSITSILGSCLPVKGVLHKRQSDGHMPCSRRDSEVAFRKISETPDSTIVISGRLTVILNGSLFDNEEGGKELDVLDWGYDLYSNGRKISIEEFRLLFERTIEEFVTAGHRVIVIGPIPEVGWNVPKRLLQKFNNGIWFRNDIKRSPITTSYDVFKKRNRDTISLYEKVKSDRVTVVYPHKIFCDTAVSDRCVTHDETNLFYSDDDHPSRVGARLISNLIVKAYENLHQR